MRNLAIVTTLILLAVTASPAAEDPDVYRNTDPIDVGNRPAGYYMELVKPADSTVRSFDIGPFATLDEATTYHRDNYARFRSRGFYSNAFWLVDPEANSRVRP